VPWEVLDHTADVGLVVTADSLEHVIEDAIAGFGELVCPEGEVDGRAERDLTVSADDLDDLVVDVLDELNFLHQTEHFVPAGASVEIDANGGYQATVTVRGEDFDPNKHGHLMEVKATTYHGLEVDEDEPRIEVIFDV
jgi:SHS2 domain-containing protein